MQLSAISLAITRLWSGSSAWTPTTLFAAGEQGGLWDFTNLSNLYQDSAGTTPVTAVGDPIGLVLDTSGRSNHLSQSTSTKRPLLGRMPATGVRNLLTYTEDFSNAAWTKSAGTSVSGQTVSFANNNDQIYFQYFPNLVSDVVFTPKMSGSGVIGVRVNGVETMVTLTGTPTRHSITGSFSGAGNTVNIGRFGSSTATSITLENTQLETGSTATAYQKVVQPYDVTESGVASVYTAYFDGVDDCLVSPSIDFTATDKMTVWAGCHATSADVAVLCDLGVHLTQTGTFTFLRPNSADATQGAKFQIYSTPPDKYSSLYTTQATGTDEVYTLAANKALSTNEVTMRLNGASVGAADFSDDVAGTFGNYPLYVGQRNAASVPYKGFLSALCARGAATDASTVESMEQWLAARTPGVVLPTPPVATYLYADDGTTLLHADDGSTVLTED